MAMRFRKSFKLAPGTKITVGKKSVGVSVGNKLGGVTANTRSGVHRRTSLPGTGISFVDKVGKYKTGRAGSTGTANRGSVDMSSNSSERKPFYKKWWVIALAVLAVIGFIQGLGGEKATPAPTDAPAIVETEEPENRMLPAAAVDPTATPVDTTGPAAVQSAETAKTFVASTDSDKYHDPDCRWAKEIAPGNELWFSTADEAEAAGYAPCGTCQ